jgi:hypothetical protein
MGVAASKRHVKAAIGAAIGAAAGRGTAQNPAGRFAATRSEPFDDGWSPDEAVRAPTTLLRDTSRTIIARNDSPDLSFDRSINPYRGCEHGCIYCFARPSHAYLGLSPGLDFETKIVFKPEAAQLLEKELSRAGYRPAVIVLGSNTDPYQPVERTLGITRALLEVLERFNHPVSIITKSAGVLRDVDILSRMAARGLAQVHLSITTLDPVLARAMEPRAASPARRLMAIGELVRAGVPDDPRPQRCGAGDDSGGGRQSRGEPCRRRIATPAARAGRAVQRLAEPLFAGAGEPCAQPDPPEPDGPAER